MKQIALTQGYFALIDDEDFDRVNKFNWKVILDIHTNYASISEKGNQILLHRFILNLSNKLIEVDHKDRNGLNNQKYNLRSCTRAQNSVNRIITSRNSSGYKGVHYHKQAMKWQARITLDKKIYSLGLFNNPIDAAKAYDVAAKRHFKEFACLNFGDI